MQILKKKLSELKPPERNVRLHPEIQIKELKRSIEAFGQVRPIIIDENNLILSGSGLFMALSGLKRKTAEVYQLKGLSNVQKKKLMVADNKIFELGATDMENLIKVLDDIRKEGDLDIPGFDEELLTSLLAEAEAITAGLLEYGKIGKDGVEELERKRQAIAKQIAEGSGQREIVLSGDNIKLDGDKPYIECSKCGRKNWL